MSFIIIFQHVNYYHIPVMVLKLLISINSTVSYEHNCLAKCDININFIKHMHTYTRFMYMHTQS